MIRRSVVAAIALTLAGCSPAALPANTSGSLPNSNVSSNAGAVRSLSRVARTFAPGRAGAVSTARTPWKGDVVYVSPTSTGYTYVYPGAPHAPKKTLYSFNLYPGVENSIQIDAQQNVYFADSYSTWVFEYAPGTNTPVKSFPTTYTPEEIALHGKTLYVFEGELSAGIADIAIYENGSTKPTRTLTDGNVQYPSGLAVDKAGNVFVGYEGPSFTSGIGEFVKGKGSMKVLNSSVLPLALAIDGAGNLLVDVAGTGSKSSIQTYPPGATSPSKSIDNLPWFYQFSLTADGKHFYAGDAGSNATSYQYYDYPSGKLVYKYAVPGAFAGIAGIAASPALKIGTW
jgi:hypothetical protein